MTDTRLDAAYCVGREPELELMRELLHGAALGDGSASIWVGEPGVGKSRLLRECATIKTSATCVMARCGDGSSFGFDVRALTARVRRHPIALLLDDLDFATTRQRAFVEEVTALAEHRPLAVIACARASDGLRSSAVVHRLPPLEDTAMELLVRSLTGSRTLETDEVREVLKTSQGSPRVAIELVDEAMRSKRAATSVPPSARAAVAQLRAELSRTEFEVLRACSVIGDAFYDEWVPAVTGIARNAVADALQRASDLGVLDAAPWSPHWLVFRHIAIRKALYASVVALRRRILHERIVERLSGAADGDPHADLVLGDHAEIVGARDCAAAAFARSAERARGAAAFSEAATLYTRATANLTVGALQWIEFQQLTMRCLNNTGDWKRMSSVAGSVLEAIDPASDPTAVEGALENLFYAQLNDGRTEAAEKTAERIASLGQADSEHRGRLANLILAYSMCYSARLVEARRLIATVEERHLDDDELRLRYLVAVAEAGALSNPMEQTIRLVENAAECARRVGIRGTVHCYGVGADIACRCGDLENARRFLKSAEGIAAKSAGTANDVWRRVLDTRIRIALLAGELPTAGALVRRNIGWRESGRHNEAFDAGVAVTIGMRTGDRALIDAFFDPQLLWDSVAANDAESCGALIVGYAEVMQVRGMSKDLRGILERCVAQQLIDPYVAIQLCGARVLPIESAALAMEQTNAYLGDVPAPAAAAHVALCKATLLRRQESQPASVAAALTAATHFGQMGWRLHEAQALELAGNLRAASIIYAECGASSDVARLSARDTRKLKYAPFVARLSPREREVARLVAAQRSNRDIARALEISVRTVEHHVEAAFSKLGIRARWELTPERLSTGVTRSAP
ncbi:MAG: LuxR C-terminal-related transcriptional regulator [Candidatus Cybelea sp.]